MGLFDKIKKAAKESMQASGIADALQKQADDVRLAMKYGITATPKNLEIAREKEAEERKAKEEAERRAKEEAERKAKEEAERRRREEAERRAQKEAERKAREEDERKAKEDAALEDVRLEEARLAQIEANRQRQAELERKEFEDAKRKVQMEAELRAMKEAEEKAQEEARQQKLAKEQEEKQNVLAPIKDYVEKAENGDGQAACQIGLWFQHGQKGLPQDTEQAKYWYQQAMVLGNQNAATFLNILVGNEQNKVNTVQKQEALKTQEEEDNRLRLKYDTEDEFLANEKNDGEAAYRVACRLNDSLSSFFNQETESLRDVEKQLEIIDQSIKYYKIAKVYSEDEETKHTADLTIQVSCRLRERTEKQKDIMEENDRVRSSMVEVWFEWERYYDSSSYTRKESGRKTMSKDEYHALIQATPDFLGNYVKKNLESSSFSGYCINVSMTAK